MSVQLAGEAFLDLMRLMLVHGTILVLLTWLASAALLRRCRPSIHAALWTVVLVKFLLPPVLPGAFGLSPLLSSLLAPAADAAFAQPATSHAPPQDDGLIEAVRLQLGPAQERQTRADFRGRLPAALLVAYAALVSVFAVRALLHSRRMRRRVRSLPAADARLAREVAAAAAKLGLARPPRVLADGVATSPFVVGAWRPALVMPASLAARIDAAAREALIIHELAHIRRGDTLVRWLRNSARLLFFFWPPVWWLCRRVERFSEMACDEWAVRLSSAGPRAYAEALLDVAKAARRGATTPGQQIALASRDEGLMAARFEMILRGDHGGRPRLTALASAALAAWGLFALAGGVSALPAGDANATTRATEHFAAAGIADQAPRDQIVIPNPASDDATRRSERKRGGTAARRPEDSNHGLAAQTSSRTSAEGVTVFRQSPRRGEARPARQTETHESKSRGVDAGFNEIDLDGDGRISDYEAGYSAGLRYRNRKAERDATAPDLPRPPRRSPNLDAETRRRIEIDLMARRRGRAADETP